MQHSPSERGGPSVLCVSESRRHVSTLTDAVSSRLPECTVETTTDPTVVPDLLYTRRVDCVVAEAGVETPGGESLQTTVRRAEPTIPVVLASVGPTANGDVAVAPDHPDSTDQAQPLSERIETALDNRPPSPAAADEYMALSTPESPIQRLVEAEEYGEILQVFESRISELPPVSETTIWTVDPSDESLTPTGDDPDPQQPSATTVAAFETGEPQHTVAQTASQSVPVETPTAITVAYPLGTIGAVSVTAAGLTHQIQRRLSRLSTVAGACLEHSRAYAQLEQRFHRIADRNRSLSQFARTVAHDLNSPLSVIYGRIELSLAEPSDAEMHLQAAMNAAQRVDSLVTDHLQTIESADAEAETEAVSVQTVAIQAWRIIDPSMARLQVEPQLGTVEANAIRLQQLFENLIRNTIEHGSEEAVGLGSGNTTTDPHAVFDDDTDSVTITIKPTATGFAVCDDGPGIPESERSKIFESGYTTTESGSGLGLHIVAEIVHSHDWEISVGESASGGARFDIETQ